MEKSFIAANSKLDTADARKVRARTKMIISSLLYIICGALCCVIIINIFTSCLLHQLNFHFCLTTLVRVHWNPSGYNDSFEYCPPNQGWWWETDIGTKCMLLSGGEVGFIVIETKTLFILRKQVACRSHMTSSLFLRGQNQVVKEHATLCSQHWSEPTNTNLRQIWGLLSSSVNAAEVYH